MAIAPRNAGRIDLRLSRSLATLRGQHAEVSVDVFNVDNFLNHQWGAQKIVPAANQALLSITGFDLPTRRYTYNVNKNFVVPVKQGDPYLVQLGMRYRF